RWGERGGRGAGAGAVAKALRAGSAPQPLPHQLPPPPRLAQRGDVVPQVVAPGDAVEHRGAVVRLLLQISTAHAPILPRPPRTHGRSSTDPRPLGQWGRVPVRPVPSSRPP